MKKKFGMATGLLMIAVLLVSMAIGNAYAKYVTQKTLENTLTITADIGTIKLLEHKAVRNADGSYYLTSETVAANSYVLIPGLDIPKDPYITIEGKSSLDSYLFLEVVDTLDGGVTYAISDQGLLLEDQLGKNGGKVYVYSNNSGNADVVNESAGETFTVSILEGNMITVSQHLLEYNTAEPDGLKFYACMGETALSTTSDAAEIYRAINNIQ